ncbi:cytochrome c biogenesis protein ResB [bacterium]|nr:cytochrome c biogenesis protein ResB [bacterium]
MRKFWIRTFQIISILLLLFLAVSTFIPQTSEFPPGAYPGTTNVLIHFFHLDRFYSSPVNVVLWGLLTGIIIGSILLKGIHTPIQKIIHLLLALCFIVIAIEKSTNQRFDFRIKEGEEIRFSNYTDSKSDKYDISIKLLDFDIQYHPGQHTAKAFISRLQIDGKDTVYLAVNKPYAIGHYRLYQSAYDQEIIFHFKINGENYPVIFGDTVFVDSSEFILEGFSRQQRVFDLKINEKYYHTGMQQPRRIDNYSIIVAPGGTRYTSIIEVAEVRWTKLLLILGSLYIAGLFIAFWRRR